MGRAKHCTDEKRNAIWNLRKKGFTYKMIAETLNCSQNMVTNALKWKEKPENRGRPRKTTHRDDRNIMKTVKINPFYTSTEIKKELKLNIDTSTIRRRLIDAEMSARKPRKVPLLSKVNIRKRLQFSRSHVSWPSEKWRNILWTDESKVNLFGSDGSFRNVRRPKNKEFCPQYTVKTVKHGGGSIMIWGCFSWYGVSPIFWIKNIMTHKEYIDILKDVMLPYAEENMPLRWIFQQDNDPKHTAGPVKLWFEENKINIMPWPSQSPDLNPIDSYGVI